ncbi:hypothetical protein Clacol_001459 [Clathrus columnatus]|uniref:Alpha-1,3-glucosyltransferase n=1 Tax=Clathrus columnatus TaxID=1419009 RepID=A0AAV4ZYA8_9AGAM|nr:hypothetical protein Clacol_001459 [Clathrus columnatus]
MSVTGQSSKGLNSHQFPSKFTPKDSSIEIAQQTSWSRLLSTANHLKLKLRSTDFEVHRNWLAITHSLPISKWYYDVSVLNLVDRCIASNWGLDNLGMEYVRSQIRLVYDLTHPKIVDLQNLNYDAWTVVAYQRTTVLVTELVLGAALLKFIDSATDRTTQRLISISLFTHPGFLIVDHIHFQYNGFMFGILLWSILKAQQARLPVPELTLRQLTIVILGK